MKNLSKLCGKISEWSTLKYLLQFKGLLITLPKVKPFVANNRQLCLLIEYFQIFFLQRNKSGTFIDAEKAEIILQFRIYRKSISNIKPNSIEILDQRIV